MTVLATDLEVEGWLGGETVAKPEHFIQEIGGLSVPEAERLAHEVTAIIHQYCRRNLRQRDVTETFYLAKPIGPRLFLSTYPIVSVSSVTIDGVSTTDYVIKREMGYLIKTGPDGSTGYIESWRGKKIVVSYRAGYFYSSGTPDDLHRAALSLGAFLHEARGRDFSLRSMSVEGVGSVSWLDPTNGGGMIPEAIRNVLDFYKDRTPC